MTAKIKKETARLQGSFSENIISKSSLFF